MDTARSPVYISLLKNVSSMSLSSNDENCPRSDTDDSGYFYLMLSFFFYFFTKLIWIFLDGCRIS